MIACLFAWITDHATVLSTVLTAIATCVLAWFTVTLVYVASGQLRELKRSVDANVSVDLPAVFLRNAVFVERGAGNLAARLQFPGAVVTFVNYGRTSAFLTQYSIVFAKGNLPKTPVYKNVINMPFGEAIESKCTYPVRHDDGHGLGDADIDEILNSRSNLWLYGFIAYHDFLDTAHKVGFCLRLDCFSVQQRAEFAFGHGPVEYTYRT